MCACTNAQRISTVFENEVLYCAGCIGTQNHAPGSLSMCSSLYKSINKIRSHAHAVTDRIFCPEVPASPRPQATGLQALLGRKSCQLLH